ncbi:hypothetical protein ACFXTH_022325 [Malus domestica]
MGRASHSHRVIQVVGQICKPNRSGNLDRSKQQRGMELLDNYFVHNSSFPDTHFRHHFRMERHLFNKIMIAVCNHDSYFVQKNDAFGVMDLLSEQKNTAALRMLAYGVSTDQVDEITRMGKSTILESLMRFCGAIKSIYTADFLRRPTDMDLQRLLKKGEMKGFPRMIRSIDCMHWTWKNCPSAWQGAYGDRKKAKRKAPKVTYWVNRHKYDRPYYLANSIYPRWLSFVKTVPRPRSAKEKHFASCQEGCRKDLERCFGILQVRWTIVRGAAKMFDVEDEYNYDVIDEYEPDTMNNSITQIYCTHDATEELVQHKPLEMDGRYNERLIQ